MKKLIEILKLKFDKNGRTETGYGSKNIEGVEEIIKNYIQENMAEVVVTNSLTREVEKFFTTDKKLIEAYRKDYENRYSNSTVDVNKVVLNYSKNYNEKGLI